MPRRTTKEEATDLFRQFAEETEEQLQYEMRATRQPRRVLELKKDMDALDRLKDRFYNYIQNEAVA